MRYWGKKFAPCRILAVASPDQIGTVIAAKVILKDFDPMACSVLSKILMPEKNGLHRSPDTPGRRGWKAWRCLLAFAE